MRDARFPPSLFSFYEGRVAKQWRFSNPRFSQSKFNSYQRFFLFKLKFQKIELCPFKAIVAFVAFVPFVTLVAFVALVTLVALPLILVGILSWPPLSVCSHL